MELGNNIGCPNITITSGILENGQDRKSAWNILEDSIPRILDFLKPSMQLLLEQEPEMLVASTEDLLLLIEHTNQRLKINLDIGHLQVNQENISQSILLLKNELINIHWEDIKGTIHQHLLPGQGDIEFTPFFSTLKNMAYSGYLTADLYPFSHMAKDAATITKKFLSKFDF